MPELLSATQQDVFTVQQVVCGERRISFVDALAVYINTTLGNGSLSVFSALTKPSFHEAVNDAHLDCLGLGGGHFTANEFEG